MYAEPAARESRKKAHHERPDMIKNSCVTITTSGPGEAYSFRVTRSSFHRFPKGSYGYSYLIERMKDGEPFEFGYAESNGKVLPDREFVVIATLGERNSVTWELMPYDGIRASGAREVSAAVLGGLFSNFGSVDFDREFARLGKKTGKRKDKSGKGKHRKKHKK